ncbi:MAG: hypothetical protein K9M14_03715 [Candidatus Omnitrophica bacterium]|nr:hypothetical protein [Candidatus Omnitrophota bacterium]
MRPNDRELLSLEYELSLLGVSPQGLDITAASFLQQGEAYLSEGDQVMVEEYPGFWTKEVGYQEEIARYLWMQTTFRQNPCSWFNRQDFLSDLDSLSIDLSFFENKKILEVGANRGDLFDFFKEERISFKDYLGIDWNLDILQYRGNKPVFAANNKAVPFKNRAFDLIILNSFLGPVHEEEIRRLLAPSGQLLVTGDERKDGGRDNGIYYLKSDSNNFTSSSLIICRYNDLKYSAKREIEPSLKAFAKVQGCYGIRDYDTSYFKNNCILAIENNKVTGFLRYGILESWGEAVIKNIAVRKKGRGIGKKLVKHCLSNNFANLEIVRSTYFLAGSYGFWKSIVGEDNIEEVSLGNNGKKYRIKMKNKEKVDTAKIVGETGSSFKKNTNRIFSTYTYKGRLKLFDSWFGKKYPFAKGNFADLGIGIMINEDGLVVPQTTLEFAKKFPNLKVSGIDSIIPAVSVRMNGYWAMFDDDGKLALVMEEFKEVPGGCILEKVAGLDEKIKNQLIQFYNNTLEARFGKLSGRVKFSPDKEVVFQPFKIALEKEGIENVEFIQSKFKNLKENIQDKCFDYGRIFNVNLHYSPEKAFKNLKDIAAVFKKGGILAEGQTIGKKGELLFAEYRLINRKIVPEEFWIFKKYSSLFSHPKTDSDNFAPVISRLDQSKKLFTVLFDTHIYLMSCGFIPGSEEFNRKLNRQLKKHYQILKAPNIPSMIGLVLEKGQGSSPIQTTAIPKPHDLVVLYAEDSLRKAKQIISFFDNKGITIIHACGLQEAKEMLDYYAGIDIIVTDNYMPDKDEGLRLIEYVRNSSRFSHLPVILFSKITFLKMKQVKELNAVGVNKLIFFGNRRLAKKIQAIKNARSDLALRETLLASSSSIKIMSWQKELEEEREKIKKEIIGSDDWRVRKKFAARLKDLPKESASVYLTGLLNDSSFTVREAAQQALEKHSLEIMLEGLQHHFGNILISFGLIYILKKNLGPEHHETIDSLAKVIAKLENDTVKIQPEALSHIDAEAHLLNLAQRVRITLEKSVYGRLEKLGEACETASQQDKILRIKKEMEKLETLLKSIWRLRLGYYRQDEVFLEQIASVAGKAAKYWQNSGVSISIKSLITKKGLKTYLPRQMVRLIKGMFQNCMEAGAKNIFFSLDYDEQKRKVIACIEDDGKGIPEEYISYIFVPFFSSKEYIPQRRGFSLTLYTLKVLIEDLGGRVLVESREDEGTKIKIYLPVFYESKTCRLYTHRKMAGHFHIVKNALYSVMLLKPEKVAHLKDERILSLAGGLNQAAENLHDSIVLFFTTLKGETAREGIRFLKDNIWHDYRKLQRYHEKIFALESLVADEKIKKNMRLIDRSLRIIEPEMARAFGWRVVSRSMDSVKVGRIIKNAITRCKAELAYKKNPIKIEYNIERRLFNHNVFTYPAEIDHSVTELLLNAVKNMPEERKKVRGLIKVGARFNVYKGEVVVKVADNGTGIKKEHTAEIFNPGYTDQTEKSLIFQSAGHGLPSLRNSLIWVGGDISVVSVYGKGSVFIFKLPVNAPLSVVKKKKIDESLGVIISGNKGSCRKVVARAIAARYGLRYISGGFLVRILVYKMMEESIDTGNEALVVQYAKSFLENERINYKSEPLKVDEVNTLFPDRDGKALRDKVYETFDENENVNNWLFLHKVAHYKGLQQLLRDFIFNLIGKINKEGDYNGIIFVDTYPWQEDNFINIRLESSVNKRAIYSGVYPNNIRKSDYYTGSEEFVADPKEIKIIYTAYKNPRQVCLKAIKYINETKLE